MDMNTDELRAALDALGWSQREMAVYAGLHETTGPKMARGILPVPPLIARWLRALVAASTPATRMCWDLINRRHRESYEELAARIDKLSGLVKRTDVETFWRLVANPPPKPQVSRHDQLTPDASAALEEILGDCQG